MGLSQKRRKFAELVAIGETAATAYRIVYDCEHSNPRTICTEASRLIHSPEVAAYVSELNERAATSAVCTRVGLLERVWRANTTAYDLITAEGETAPSWAFPLFTKTVDQLVRMGAVSTIDDDETEQREQLARLGYLFL